MACALFGKLPAKRDFVSRHVPNGFSQIVEPWLHEGLAISRNVLGTGWQEADLSAPIWRFWLPPGLTHQGIIGAIMPSVDGIGRFFPLTIMSAAPQGGGFAHPSHDPHSAWFDAVEGILLGALGEEVSLDTVLTWMSRLSEPVPAEGNYLLAPEDKDRARETGKQRPLGPGLHRLRRAPPPPYTATAWWTTGGVDYPPTALAWDGMPETSFFREMITAPVAVAAPAGPPTQSEGASPAAPAGSPA